MSGTRARSKALTQKAIRSAAHELFVAHGYETVTLRMIALRAGFSTGATFAQWGSKDDLFADVMGRPHITDAMGAVLLEQVAADYGLVAARAMLRGLANGTL